VHATYFDSVASFDGVGCLSRNFINPNTLLLKKCMPLLAADALCSVAKVCAKGWVRAVGLNPHILVVAWVNAFFKDSGDQWGSAGHVRGK
jgi:hypothetical protein